MLTREECDQILMDQRLIRRDFNRHVSEFKRHEELGVARHLEYLRAQQNHTDAILQLSNSTESMKEVLEAWNAFNGAVRVGGVLGRFMSWVLKLSFVGAAIAFVVDVLRKFTE